MISEGNAYSYCHEDISKIENYDKAVNDKTQVWHCHHRGEVLPCGHFYAKDLKIFGLYFNRPASELIFLTKSEHLRIHKKGCALSQEHRHKVSMSLIGNNRHKGFKNTKEQKKRISDGTKKGMRKSWNKFIESRKIVSKKLKGSHMNVGKDNPNYGKRWMFITDGKHNKRQRRDAVIPDGWKRGLTIKKLSE